MDGKILTECLPKGRPYGIPTLACLNADDFSRHRKVLLGSEEEARGETTSWRWGFDVDEGHQAVFTPRV